MPFLQEAKAAAQAIAQEADFHFSSYMSFTLLTPMNEFAQAWVNDYLPDAMIWNCSVVIEPRYVDDILEGINDAALKVRVL